MDSALAVNIRRRHSNSLKLVDRVAFCSSLSSSSAAAAAAAAAATCNAASCDDSCDVGVVDGMPITQR